MLSRSTVVGALVIAELAVVGLAVKSVSFGAIGFGGFGGFHQNGQPAPEGVVLDRSLASSNAPHVVIDVKNTSVTVRAGLDGRVHVVETLHKFGWTSSPPRQIVASATADGVSITTSDGPNVLMFGGYSRSIVVEVPAGSRVGVTTDDGTVAASGLRAPLVVRAGDGSVKVADQQGDLDVQAGDGRITLDRVAASHLLAHSDDGSIDASDVLLVDGSLSSDDGHVHVTATPGSDATVDLHTDDGSVKVAGAIAEAGDGDHHHRTVTLGTAHGRFSIGTSSGSVTLTQGIS